MRRRTVTWSLIGVVLGASAFSACDGPKNELQNTADTTKASWQSSEPISTESLLRTIDDTLERNRTLRMLSSDRNAAWQVIHGAVAYGDRLPMEVEGKQVSALQYLFQGGALRGWEPHLTKDHPESGRLGVRFPVDVGTYVGQGHSDQWIGYLSQQPISLDTPIQLDGNTITVRDWAKQCQWDVSNNPYREYSWTLIALTNYFPDQLEWKAQDGNTWTLEPLVKFEAQQDLESSSCGGMHRLMGLAHAVAYHRRQGALWDQGWGMAKRVVEDSLQKAKHFQNQDGSFSTNYTIRSGVSSDLSLNISATGHTLEFVVYAVDKSQLQEAWIQRAVRRLCEMLKAGEAYDLECGGVYHALSALRIYKQRLAAEGA